MFRILKSEYPHLNFGVDSESTFHIVEEEEEEDDGEIVVVSRAFARVDMIITSWRDGEDPQIVLLIEHKIPGTLRKSDWENNTLFNAEEIVRQVRKYLYACYHDTAGIYDSTALVGCRLDFQTYPLWHSLERIEMKIFFEDRSEKFLYAIIAMVTQGLLMRRRVSGWRW